MEQERCPYCGFAAHPVRSDGTAVIWQCERCKAFFQVKR